VLHKNENFLFQKRNKKKSILNLQGCKMSSFFEKTIVNWLPIDTLFANTTTFFPSQGVAEFSLSPYDTCISNCTLLQNHEECKRYCASVQDVLTSSIDYAARACRGHRNIKKCCTSVAQTDDNAYTYCLLHTTPPFSPASDNRIVVIIVVLSLLCGIYLCIAVTIIVIKKKLKI